MSSAPLPYEQVVFSGGGLRCVWHGGFIEALTRDAELRPKRVTGVSGGAVSAAAWLAGCGTKLRDTLADLRD